MKVLLILSACCYLVASVSVSEVASAAKAKAPKDEPKLWALLVAGSNTWGNYRHQADVCHAYQILHRHGIPDERIVVMMYDDIANNEENPTPGIIINHVNGSDVYHGVPKDYTGEHVTPSVFLSVLQGKSADLNGIGSGKVINSGPNDHVFVNFVDHGAPGLIAFPEGELKAAPLNKALQNMFDNKQYAKLVFYLEACESGSMFSKLLPKNINVFATTAANGHESSYACYFDKKRETYLGDVYSVKWMEDSDKENIEKETLNQQFKIVKQETNTSHVQEYGDLTIGNMTVGEFQGLKQATPIDNGKFPLDAVPGPDVALAILHHKLASATSHQQIKEIRMKISALIQRREYIDRTVELLVHMLNTDSRQILTSKMEITDFVCHDRVTTHFSRMCFPFSQYEYALRKVQVLVNLCESHVPVESILKAMDNVCYKLSE